MKFIIAVAVILFATTAWCDQLSDEIYKTQAEITRLESQKRLSADMEPKGLRRNIAAKKEYLNDLYFIQAGGTREELQQRKMQKQLDRIEDKVDTIHSWQ